VSCPAAKAFKTLIVTKVSTLEGFYPAEAYHRDFATVHPNNLYIVINDAPKVVHLQQRFGDLYNSQPVLTRSKGGAS
jgi:peptide-methionine (S)-S-oxide reductase